MGEYGFRPAAPEPEPVAPPPLAPGERGGMMANVAAGMQSGGAGAINVLSDPFGNIVGRPLTALGLGAYNLGARAFGYDPVSADKINAILDDGNVQPGSQLVDALDKAGGVPNPSQVIPQNDAERYARAAAEGVTGMMALGPIGGVRLIGAGLATGAASGVGSQLGQDLLPDDLKAAGSVLGGIALPSGIHITGGALRGGFGAVANPLLNYVAPTRGTPNVLLDVATGAPLESTAGVPVMATEQQARMAGNRIQAQATNPQMVRDVLANPPPNPIPNDQPTTFQMTRDPGLGMMERGISRTPAASPDFVARAAQQNDARVAAVDSIAPAADPSAVSDAVQAHASEVAEYGAARVAQAQEQTASQIAQAQAAEGARIQALHGEAQTALEGMGGDHGPAGDSIVGQALRAPIADANTAARAAEGRLWDAIDPDRTLAVNMRPIRDGATAITEDGSPNAKPLSGEEEKIFQTAAEMPDVQPFRDLVAFRNRITDELRVQRGLQGNPQSVRRLSILLGHVHDAMEESATGSVEREAATPSQQGGDQTTVQRLNDWSARQREQQQATATSTGGIGADGIGNSAGTGPASDVGAFRAEGEAGGGFGGAAGYTGLPRQEPLTPNFDAEAQARYAAARQATVDRTATFKNAPGVGTALQGGPAAGTFRTADNAVPNIIVKTGPAGADTARAYLAAGGTPDALTDAAAFSLRQAAMRADGTLDPQRFAQWQAKRASFLSQIPDAQSSFGLAADAQRALETGQADATARMTEAQRVATATINEATARQAEANKAIQTSALGKFLGDADPVTRVAEILRSPTGAADMANLRQTIGNNPDAVAGLQRAVAEYVLRDMRNQSMGLGGNTKNLSGARFQTLLDQREPALAAALTPEQMTTMRNVADSLMRSDPNATKVGVGSNTAQDTANVGRVGGGPETFMQRLIKEGAGTMLGGGSGATIGSMLFGPSGAVAGGLVGSIVGKAFQASREAGIKTVDDLTMQAMLNPAIARVLMTKVTPQNQASLMSALATQLRRISLVGGVIAGNNQQPSQRRNALLPN